MKACDCTRSDGGPIAETGRLQLRIDAAKDGTTIAMLALFVVGPSCCVCGKPWTLVPCGPRVAAAPAGPGVKFNWIDCGGTVL